MNKSILEILDLDLTKEQKEALLGKLANDIMKENEKDDSKTFEETRQELIEKNRQKASENRRRVHQYELDSEIKYKSDVLELVKHPTKDYYMFSKTELDRMSLEELFATYDEYSKYWPEAMKKAKEEYAKNKNNISNNESNKGSNNGSEDNHNTKDDNNTSSNDDSTNRDSIKVGKYNVLKNPPKNLAKRRYEFAKEELEDDNEIVDEEDCPELTMKDKVKNIAKKVLKAGAVLGGLGLVGFIAYQFLKQGDTNQVADIIQNAQDTISSVAKSNLDNSILNDNTVGTVKEVFDRNMEAYQNINAETSDPTYFQNEILGYANSDNQMISANNIGDLVEASNNGQDITSIYVGDENGIDGFVNTINDKPLDEFLETFKGGKTR